MGRGGERASARPPVVGGGGFFLKPPKLVQDTHTPLFIVCHLCFQVGRVLGSRSRSVLANTVSVRLLGCFGVGRFGPGLVLVCFLPSERKKPCKRRGNAFLPIGPCLPSHTAPLQIGTHNMGFSAQLPAEEGPGNLTPNPLLTERGL